MKFRYDFVTNSSAASFTIPLDKLTFEQIIMIYNHIEVGKIMLSDLYNEWFQDHDEWLIYIDGNVLHGETSMDNFSMREFLYSINVKSKDYQYEFFG